MIHPGLSFMHKRQRGFTLVELLVAIAIAGVITGGITATVMQVLNINHRASNHMICVRQVQQAGKEVSKDTLQSQNVTCGEESGFPLTLTWTDWGGAQNVVVYDVTEDNELQRSQTVDDEPVSTTLPVVAKYIDPAGTSCVWDGSVLTFTVTAAVGTESETRIYEIEPRPTPPSS
jgi:prepilin-type N-terminal cleavage/methylation domain-containing protein